MRELAVINGGWLVGSPMPSATARVEIFQPGPSRWYALRVAPQREDQAEGWLRQREVYAFHPVLVRHTRRCGVVRQYHRRYLPGYVFARFRGDPLVHRVMSCPWIIGALSRADGQWGALEACGLQAIHSMRRIDAEHRAQKSAILARRVASARISAGDSAMFKAGPFSGLPCEVVELMADGGAVVRLNIFGRDTPAMAHPGDLVPLRKAS